MTISRVNVKVKYLPNTKKKKKKNEREGKREALINLETIKITSNFSLNKLIQTISCCEIIIGNESGPVCIGAALNKKVLSIYNDKTSKPESKIISKKIKYFNTSKLNTTKIINAINKYIIKNS